MRFVWTALNEFEALIALLDVTVKTLTLKKDRMLQAAVGNYCTVTELANCAPFAMTVSPSEVLITLLPVWSDTCSIMANSPMKSPERK